MCIRKIIEWFNQSPVPVPDPVTSKRQIISATINDYPGNINDLNGCNNDGNQVKATVLNYWPDCNIIRLIDSKATVNAFKTTVSNAIDLLSPGATVIVLSDSCYSGGNTRPLIGMGLTDNPHPTHNRFSQTPGVPRQRSNPLQLKTFVGAGDINWIVFSGCGATQYSADAWIENEYHGAFTWFAMKTLLPGLTYRQWYNLIKKHLPSREFEQDPTLEGKNLLLDRMVFEGETLMIHNSTHGTELQGVGEIDQAICLYDGNLRDKEYYKILSAIPE